MDALASFSILAHYKLNVCFRYLLNNCTFTQTPHECETCKSLNLEYWFIAFLPLWINVIHLLILMFCNSLPVGWSFNINAGYMFGIFLKTLGQVLVCYKLNQDQTQFSAALMLLVVWVKIAKAEPQFSDLIYELQHHHGPGHARTASTSCPAQ